MIEGIKSIDQKVTSFKRKYYLNLLLRGLLLTASVVLIYFVLAAVLEYNLWLGKSFRLLIFTLFFVLVGVCVFLFLKEPLQWWIAKRGLGEEESARIIGDRFPSIKDRLLNLIQLTSIGQKSALLQASIAQKSSSFEGISFESAIDLYENKRYLKLFLIPLVLIASLFIINKSILTQSTTRIVKFNEEFSPQAPFLFVIENKNLSAFLHEDFTIKLRLKGSVIPDATYLLQGKQRLKMISSEPGLFEYTFEKIQDELDIQFEASGFYSQLYRINLISRPELIQMKALLNYPGYLGKNKTELFNVGNLEVPEGTKVTWTIGTDNAAKASILFSEKGIPNEMQIIDNQHFNFSKEFRNPDEYSIILENDKSKNKDQISYSVNVVKDAYPQIVVNDLRDSILYKSIFLGGVLSDDYGITKLKLNYQIISNTATSPVKEISIPIFDRRQQQNFFYQWSVDSLKLNPGDKINYYLQVWDNDGVNGHKATRSANYLFALPTNEELKTNIAQSQQSAENKIDQSLKKASDLKESINEAQQKLKGKQSLEWQDKKMLEEIVQQKQKLDQAIKELQKENTLLEQKKETFSEESERIKEKSDQIQKLMNELLDEETKKLFEELEKLLKENSDLSQIQKMLEKMDRKEINLEKELERTLELFKQLQYDYKLEQSIEEIKEQTKAQEDLLKKTEGLDKKSDKENSGDDNKDGEKSSSEKLANEQEELNNKFQDFKKELKELEKLGEELDKGDVPGDEQMEQIEKSQENSKESLKQGKPKKSTEHQKNTINQMKQAKDQLEGMQSSMEMEMDMENLESLRQILHGLIKLSYDQESLMKDFNAVQQTDPKYVQLSQQQLKVKDDAKVLEDSLLALSKRDAFMASVVTKEVGELNDHIDKSVGHIKDRRKSNASSEMQFSMTGINNLALMLNDRYNQMMNMMASSMPQMGKGKGKKQSKMPKSLSDLQKQLNQQIQQLKNGNMPGRQLSEQLAKTAAEQERIRRALEEMQQKLKQEGGKGIGDDIPLKMEQTEMDLVNKNITEMTIRRQQEILTRLLETEKSMREQNMDEERKGETAKDYQKEIPKAFEEYLRLKEKEVELLKTVPPKLFPYYKKEVNDYFKRIEKQD